MNQSVISVIGKDRVCIVYDVAKILADNQINIMNISQQLMGEFFTMIILVDAEKCSLKPTELAELLPMKDKNWLWIFVFKMKRFLTLCTVSKSLF